MYSLDPSSDAARHMKHLKADAKRINATEPSRPLPTWHYLQLDGRAITAAHVGGEPIEFVYMDAAHRLEESRATFQALVPLLSDSAIVAVHDTGVWSKAWLDENQPATTYRFGRWLTREEANETWRVGPVHRAPTGEE